MADSESKAEELRTAIAGLESQRATLGDAVVAPALAALRQQLTALTAPPVPSGAEERKTVTIVFVDVSGFTALSENLDPEEVRNIINACFDHLVPIVQKYDGTIDKFIGDEIMALFGAPVAHENDPERGLRSALEMMRAIASFNQAHRTALSLHIGVNTGPVVTGAIGSKERRDYSVMGDAVNLAARLEDASGDGEIYVGPNTYRLTNSVFEFEALPPMSLKGKTGTVTIYRLIGPRAKPRDSRGIQGLHCELIGRHDQLEQLRAATNELSGGRGGIVSVVGEAGVGKSRLINEAFGRFAVGFGVAEGRALSHTGGMSLWTARGLVRDLINIGEQDSTETQQQALRAALDRLVPQSAPELHPYLATLLQLPLDEKQQERVQFLSSEALQGRIFQSVRQYIESAAEAAGLVLFWEDLHWCDPSSLLLLESLLPLTRRVPLLIVLAYRPDEAAPPTFLDAAAISEGANFRLLDLRPLNRDQSESLVAGLLSISDLPPQLCKLIVDRSDGNPFFIEELLRSLIDSGEILVEHGRIMATPKIAEVRIPETVQGVLAARIDRLAASPKSVLQSAAVIGRNFNRDVLLHVDTVREPNELDEHLRELTSREFIHSTANDDRSSGDYMFKHAITQDVAYNALLKTRRRELHGQVGRAFERLFPDRISELAATLAYHFERAEDRGKTFRYSKQAGEHAQSIFANAEAAGFYRSAIAQATELMAQQDDFETRINLASVHESLGDVLHLSGHSDAARASFCKCASLISADDRIRRSRLQRKIGSTHTLQRRYQLMTEAYDAADAELGDAPVDPATEWWHEKMQILLERLHLLYWQGMSDEMNRLAEHYETQIEQKGTAIQRGKFYQMLGLSHLTRGRYQPSSEAVRLCELAAATGEGSSQLAEAAHVRFTAGLTNLFNGNLDPAVRHLEAALDLGQRVGDLAVQARSLAYLTVSHRRRGDHQQTQAFADRTIAISQQLGIVEYVAMAKANLAWLAWRQSRPNDAILFGAEALALWHGMEDPYGVDWQAVLPMAAVAFERSRIREAIEYLRGLFRDTQHPLPPELAIAAREAITAYDLGDAEATTSKLEDVIQVAKKISYL